MEAPQMETENTSPQSLNKKTVQPLLLLEEIIEEILSRLPVKTLLRFKCVSKPWLDLIESDRFIKTHLQNSRKNQTYAHWKLIFNFHPLKQCSFCSYLEDQKMNPSPLHDPTNDHLMTGRVMGSCDGILCILKQGCFFLWNPAMRICRELPKIGSRIKSKYGFGWDEQSGAYKVFVGVSDQDQDHDQRIGKVYSSKTDSWKTVEHGHLAVCCGTGKLECGKIHWLTSKGDYIESFDLDTEEFGRIELPSKPEVAHWLWENVGCLSVVCSNGKSTRRFWVMKKYGVKESWVEVEKETWVEVISQPSNRIHGCNGGFFYIESLVSPPPPDLEHGKN